MKIQVTKEDIDQGIREHPMECPVALALHRALPGCSFLVASLVLVYRKGSADWCSGSDDPVVRLAPRVRDFIRVFDTGQARPDPFEFELPKEVEELCK